MTIKIWGIIIAVDLVVLSSGLTAVAEVPAGYDAGKADSCIFGR